MRHDRRQHDNRAATSLTASSPVTPPTQPCQTPIRGSKILLPHSSSCPRPIADRCTPIRWSEDFRGTNSKKRAGQSPKNFPTNKIFLPKIPGLGAEIFHPFSSLRPAKLNRFPEKIPKKLPDSGEEDFIGRKIFQAADRRAQQLGTCSPVSSRRDQNLFWWVGSQGSPHPVRARTLGCAGMLPERR